jgi:hypothetical protein
MSKRPHDNGDQEQTPERITRSKRNALESDAKQTSLTSFFSSKIDASKLVDEKGDLTTSVIVPAQVDKKELKESNEKEKEEEDEVPFLLPFNAVPFP